MALTISWATMDVISEREYSRLLRGAIKDAKCNKTLACVVDGTSNAAASDARRVEMTDPDRQRHSLGCDAAIPISGGDGKATVHS